MIKHPFANREPVMGKESSQLQQGWEVFAGSKLALKPFSLAGESLSDLIEVAKESYCHTPFDRIYLFPQDDFAIKMCL